jgi:hypothetical protein
MLFLPKFDLKLLFWKKPHWTLIAGPHWVLLCWDALHHKLKIKEISPWNISCSRSDIVEKLNILPKESSTKNTSMID